MEKSKVKCKCGSADITLVEIWRNFGIEFDQKAGIFDRNNTVQMEGEPHKVEATCVRCGKAWTVRGALQIDDIIKD